MNQPPPFSHPAFRGWFGVARKDVTPPVGIYSRSWGAAAHDCATSVHRPITLTVLTLQSEKEASPLALIALDLCVWNQPTAKILAHAVESAGIAPGRYVIALSHTHAGPATSPAREEKPGGQWIAGYREAICKAIGEGIAEALSSARPGLLETATGRCGLATNRDLPDPGRDRYIVGWNPNLPADDTLLVGRITGTNGETLATLINYACHPTILAWENEALSPDYVGAMREVVESATGAPALFMQGASGELAARHQYVGTPEVADRAGLCLGYAVLSLLSGMLPPGRELAYTGVVESGAPLAVWSLGERASIPGGETARTVTTELEIKPSLETAGELLEQIASCTDRVVGERLERRLTLRKGLGDGATHCNRHHLWKLGEIAFVSIPNEAYSALQVALREAASPMALFVVTLANHSQGYLAPAEFYRHEHYASWQSPYEPGCFEVTLERLRSAVKDLL